MEPWPVMTITHSFFAGHLDIARPATQTATKRAALTVAAANKRVMPATSPATVTRMKISRVAYQEDAVRPSGIFETMHAALIHHVLNLDAESGLAKGLRAIIAKNPEGIELHFRDEDVGSLLHRFDHEKTSGEPDISTVYHGIQVKKLAIQSPRLFAQQLAAMIVSRHLNLLKLDEKLSVQSASDEPVSRSQRGAMLKTITAIIGSIESKSQVVVTGKDAEYPRVRAQVEKLI